MSNTFGTGDVIPILVALGGGAGIASIFRSLIDRRTAKSEAAKAHAEADRIAVEAAEKAVAIVTEQMAAQSKRIAQLESRVDRLRRRVTQLEDEMIRQGLEIPPPLESSSYVI